MAARAVLSRRAPFFHLSQNCFTPFPWVEKCAVILLCRLNCAVTTKRSQEGRGTEQEAAMTAGFSHRPLSGAVQVECKHCGFQVRVWTLLKRSETFRHHDGCHNGTIVDECISLDAAVLPLPPARCFMQIRANASNYLQIALDPGLVTPACILSLGDKHSSNTRQREEERRERRGSMGEGDR